MAPLGPRDAPAGAEAAPQRCNGGQAAGVERRRTAGAAVPSIGGAEGAGRPRQAGGGSWRSAAAKALLVAGLDHVARWRCGLQGGRRPRGCYPMDIPPAAVSRRRQRPCGDGPGSADGQRRTCHATARSCRVTVAAAACRRLPPFVGRGPFQIAKHRLATGRRCLMSQLPTPNMACMDGCTASPTKKDSKK